MIAYSNGECMIGARTNSVILSRTFITCSISSCSSVISLLLRRSRGNSESKHACLTQNLCLSSIVAYNTCIDVGCQEQLSPIAIFTNMVFCQEGILKKSSNPRTGASLVAFIGCSRPLFADNGTDQWLPSHYAPYRTMNVCYKTVNALHAGYRGSATSVNTRRPFESRKIG